MAVADQRVAVACYSHHLDSAAVFPYRIPDISHPEEGVDLVLACSAARAGVRLPLVCAEGGTSADSYRRDPPPGLAAVQQGLAVVQNLIAADLIRDLGL